MLVFGALYSLLFWVDLGDSPALWDFGVLGFITSSAGK